MKKLAITMLVLTALTPAFAAPTKSSPSALYPMDSFNPNKFTASSSTEFVKKYSSEADVFLKKGEFETTAEYEARLAKGIKIKSLGSDKIYAFQLDSISTTYNPGKTRYEIKLQSSRYTGNLFGDSGRIITSFALDERDIPTPQNTLRVGKTTRTSGQYKVSKDFYIESSTSFTNVYDANALTFPAEIDNAKKNASCKKQVYVFAKLNGETYKNRPYDAPMDMFVRNYTIPMDIVAMVLKCSTGTVLSVYETLGNKPSESDTQQSDGNPPHRNDMRDVMVK
ncbi:hypothetical protein [Acinetobacter sp. YH12106]|uniref:hypothetical protein n=1 Tax=Acinetobacter sp. YH12106 TaxID=2601094 RepID=UPI0015D14D77|nr:hypothetical protein [Acinetobacter sp. YH12106]